MKNNIAAILALTLVLNLEICFAQSTLVSEKHIEQINKLVEELAQHDKFSGTVLIANNQNIVYSKAIGIANKQQNSAINADTKFNIASMSKMFTGIAIAQLVEQHQLKFSDKLIHILPYLPKDIYGKITIHHLLTHTAGTGDIFRNPKFWDIKDTAKSISTYVNIGIDDPLWGEPGAKFEYSNYGYILLGAVIEKISNLSYYDYVKKNIFEIAGMQNTDSYETDQHHANMAIGYTVPAQKTKQASDSIARVPNTNFIEVKGTSAGGGYSTANDLHLFWKALLDGKLLSKQGLEIMTTGKIVVPAPAGLPDTPDNKTWPQRKYGYGFGESFKNNIRIIGHNGGAPGVNAHFYMYPALGYMVAVLANYDRAGEPVINFIQNIITQQN